MNSEQRELVDLLRALGRWEHDDHSLGTDAADEIERLLERIDRITAAHLSSVSENERLRFRLDEAEKIIESLRLESLAMEQKLEAALSDEQNRLASKCEELQKETESLREEIERLKKESEG